MNRSYRHMLDACAPHVMAAPSLDFSRDGGVAEKRVKRLARPFMAAHGFFRHLSVSNFRCFRMEKHRVGPSFKIGKGGVFRKERLQDGFKGLDAAGQPGAQLDECLDRNVTVFVLRIWRLAVHFHVSFHRVPAEAAEVLRPGRAPP